MRDFYTIFAVAMLSALAFVPRSAAAGEVNCGRDVKPTLVHYLETTANLGDQRCDALAPGTMPTGTTCKIDLQGVVYAPPGNAKAPVVVFNHGSEGLDYCAVAKAFTNHGYIVFVPFRRGHGGDVERPGASPLHVQSTGIDTTDVLNSLEKQSRHVKEVSVGPLLETATVDVAAALEFVQKRLANADKKKVAVGGHSFGGMMALMAAADVKGFSAVIDISGGCLSWDGNPDLQAYLKTIAKRISIPVLMIQGASECSKSEPWKTLGPILPPASYAPKPYPLAGDCRTVHSLLLKSDEGQALWRATALAFLANNGLAP